MQQVKETAGIITQLEKMFPHHVGKCSLTVYADDEVYNIANVMVVVDIADISTTTGEVYKQVLLRIQRLPRKVLAMLVGNKRKIIITTDKGELELKGRIFVQFDALYFLYKEVK